MPKSRIPWWIRLIRRVFALPITAEISRLNDNLEAIMLHFSIPLPSQLPAKPSQLQIFDYDEESAAVEEYLAESKASGPFWGAVFDGPSAAETAMHEFGHRSAAEEAAAAAEEAAAVEMDEFSQVEPQEYDHDLENSQLGAEVFDFTPPDEAR